LFEKDWTPLNIETFPVEGLKLITLRNFPDDRGFFVERFKTSQFKDLGLPTKFVQDNFSRSSSRVLRGLHYQWEKPQGKLVTCTAGKIFDVAVDIRAGSPTYGRVTSVELSGEKPQWFWIPPGFAHGFCVVGDQDADVFYKCTAEYNPQCESGIRWSDESFKIEWPIKTPQVSPRDEQMQSFFDYQKNPKFKWDLRADYV
jgi:dTDP-4-dehydrorhamnose 3,5-epimerase